MLNQDTFPLIFNYPWLCPRVGMNGRAILCKIQKHNFQEIGEVLSVNPNETVSLNCSVVQGAPAGTIRWSKEGNGANGQRIFTRESESVPGLWSSLRMNNVSAEDAGRYKCEMKKGVLKDVCEVALHVNCKLNVRTYSECSSGYSRCQLACSQRWHAKWPTTH